MRLDRRHDRAGSVLVQVGATNAAGRNAYDDFTRARVGRPWHLLDPDVLRGVEAQGSHGTIRSARSRANSSVNEDSVSRTPSNPSRPLRPISVHVSPVRPRVAS